MHGGTCQWDCDDQGNNTFVAIQIPFYQQSPKGKQLVLIGRRFLLFDGSAYFLLLPVFAVVPLHKEVSEQLEGQKAQFDAFGYDSGNGIVSEEKHSKDMLFFESFAKDKQTTFKHFSFMRTLAISKTNILNSLLLKGNCAFLADCSLLTNLTANEMPSDGNLDDAPIFHSFFLE